MEVEVAAGPAGSRYNYVVTAHKPTAVSHSVVGHFTSTSDINLIISRSTRVEIHTLSAEGLQGVMDVPIYGRITALELFRPKSATKDLLFLLTEKYKFCVLEYNADAGGLVTKAYGDARDSIGRPADNGQLAVIDPDCRMIALHLYGGMLKIIPITDKGDLTEAFNIRLDELNVVDIKFLVGRARPTIAMLYEDTKHARHIKTYEVVIKDKDLAEGPWAQSHLDTGASLIIALPKPLGGALVVGENVITYFNTNHPLVSVPLRQTIIKAGGQVDDDGSRYLLSDQSGVLHLLVLAHDGSRVGGLKLEIVGRTSSAQSISYLDNGVVYIGSRTGDSQLVRLHAEPVQPALDLTNFCEVLEVYPNLGPVVDFCVVDLERQGQGQIVTCSGVLGEGSLRIIRNGIGINEQATVELAGIKGVWALRATWMDAYDKYLVLTFVGETRLLAINADEELDEASVAGFDAAAQTLYCGNSSSNHLVQVTGSSVRLVDPDSQALVAEWHPPTGYNINVAAGSPSQILLATGEGHLVLLAISEAGLQEVGRTKLASEIACVDITPIGEDAESSQLAAVGCWDMQLSLLQLPSLQTVLSEPLGGEVIPRSVLLSTFDSVPYVLCGMGDGQLNTWRVDSGVGSSSSGSSSLLDRKKVMLGTKPILLRTFRSNGGTNVFAASDRPTVIYSSNKKLVYSNLNENEVNFMASFNSSSFPDSLAIAKEGALTIGTIDEIQKLHVRTVPLHEQPRRLVHQEATKTFGVLTMAPSELDEGASYLRVLDDTTFDIVASHSLDAQEMPCSICSASFSDEPGVHYYIIGTAIVRHEEMEPSKGRLLVLQYSDGKLTVMFEKEVKGAVYNVLPFQGKLLASVNNRVHLYRWLQRDGGARELASECSQHGHVLALYLAARGHFIAVGDLMRSVALLMYKPEEGTLELRAHDYNSVWTTAVEMLDDDTYLVADNSYNLYTLRKNSDAAADEDRSRLEVVGEFHLGAFINRFRHGSLVMRLPDSELSSVPTLLYGSIDGSIGLIASLPKELFDVLLRLQDAMRGVVRGVGGLDHASWRAYSSERKTAPAHGFVDGDLIELFLDLQPQQAATVAAAVGGGLSVEELTKRVEELARLH